MSAIQVLVTQTIKDETYPSTLYSSNGLRWPLDLDWLRWPLDLDWLRLSRYTHLSEAFIDRYECLVDWSSISSHQKLSESFIERFHDRVDWDEISHNQVLSEAFMDKHESHINWSWSIFTVLGPGEMHIQPRHQKIL